MALDTKNLKTSSLIQKKMHRKELSGGTAFAGQ